MSGRRAKTLRRMARDLGRSYDRLKADWKRPPAKSSRATPMPHGGAEARKRRRELRAQRRARTRA